MVEALVAISALLVGFLGFFSLLASSIAANRTASETYTANYLAMEGMEVVEDLLGANAINKSNRGWNCGFSDNAYEVEYNSFSALDPGNPANVCAGDALELNQGRTLYLDPGVGIYSYNSAGTPTTFVRKITITNISPDEMRVNSEVSWIAHGGGSFSVNLEDHFWNWRP